MAKYDETDLVIIRTLIEDGRITWSDLAQRLKLSAPSTADRVRRLEESGIIVGYHAEIKREALGYSLTAYVAIDLTGPKFRDEFLELVRDRDEVIECHHVTGDHDYLLKVVCRDTEHLNQFLSRVLKGGSSVSKTYTSIVLGDSKEVPFSPSK